MDDATKAQLVATNTEASIWLSANAGSGKTRVLTDRVARLLLDGAPPETILCLTYTTAAANEMKIRLLRNLGRWSMLADDDLKNALNSIGVCKDENTPKLRRTARTIFASAVEAPGGIKIQTIHAFCAAILRRFPLEAGVSPDFIELDENMSRNLRTTITDKMAKTDKDLRHFIALEGKININNLQEILDEIIYNQTFFAQPPTAQMLGNILEHPSNKSRQDIIKAACDCLSPYMIKESIAILRKVANKAKTMAQLANNLEKVAFLNTLEKKFNLLSDVFLTQKYTARKNYPTQAVNTASPKIFKALITVKEHIERAHQELFLQDIYEKTRALYALGQAFLKCYNAEKTAQGLLDFDDLIHKTYNLLNRTQAAAWVLYRLDGDINHILVDEAQDTTPLQWKIIRILSEEITAGKTIERKKPRTLFVVGDPKQSIFSFQGAEPSAFNKNSDYFSTRFRNAKLKFKNHDLRYSFRSSQPILEIVDKVFAPFKEGDIFTNNHQTFKTALPGRVDIWPLYKTDPPPDLSHWTDPVDMVLPSDGHSKLAHKIATQIKAMIGQPLANETGQTRPITPGDILILMRSRQTPLFPAIISACKNANIPVAGADRLKVMDEMAVKDLIALLKFLAQPKDDLSLGIALRSPLFGWGEEQLFDIAYGRKKSTLFQSLYNNSAKFSQTYCTLKDLRNHVDYLRPYELLQKILIYHKGRQKILARLGYEAEEGIDAFLELALAYEKHNIPSLDGFLSWLFLEKAEIKRTLQSNSQMLRIMTIHGAKGLEAPIVILPQTILRKNYKKTKITEISKHNIFVTYPTEATENVEIIKTHKAKVDDKESHERLRLLYVAMTRARQWLVVAGHGTPQENDWYSLIKSAFSDIKHFEISEPDAQDDKDKILRIETGKWAQTYAKRTDISCKKLSSAKSYKDQKTTKKQPYKIPKWLTEQAPSAATQYVKNFTPSTLNTSTVAPSHEIQHAQADDENYSIDDHPLFKGRFLHAALDYLTRTPPAKAALEILHKTVPEEYKKEAENLISSAETLISTPELAFLFAKNAQGEVPLSVRLPDWPEAPFYGIIDRLIVTSKIVWAVDFKTTQNPATNPNAISEQILCQMGAYKKMLAILYPQHTIKMAILWTENHVLMPIPDTLTSQALSKARKYFVNKTRK